MKTPSAINWHSVTEPELKNLRDGYPKCFFQARRTGTRVNVVYYDDLDMSFLSTGQLPVHSELIMIFSTKNTLNEIM